jgi:transcriptional regulator with XRE-family HTH domain
LKVRHPPTISNWIKELKYPRIGKIEELAKYFNVPKSRITERQDVVNEEQDTIAAHFDKENLTEEEMEEVRQFIEIIKRRGK